MNQDFAFAAGASGGMTSDGFTQFTLNGPAPGTCTIVSPLLDSKCRTSFGIDTKFPAFIGVSLLSSKLSPIPTKKTPLSTVTFSSVGCQCAGILEPSVQRIRITNVPASAFTSPDTGARSQPLMIGVHFRSPGRTILWAAGSPLFCC